MAASSDSEDESFVELGKPLPFIEGEGKTKPITLQDAPQRSAKGRPRFHGAFTGGFSAGFFNTVGTKEGWTPSTFVSSRQQKQDITTHQPEDFMDEEDLGEHGIAPRLFATSDTFSSDAQSRKRRADILLSTRDSVLPASAALTDLIVPERLPIGIKLLRKMGWKEGQGIGPRVKVKKKKRKENKAPGVRIYGCARPPQSDEDESDPGDLDLENITFAPKDVTPISLVSKDNVHGLGYHGLDPRSALPTTHISLFEAPAIRSSKSQKGIRGQAFGVGALEEEDEDIYTTDSLSNYDQTMELDDSEHLFGWTAPGSRKGKGKQQDQPKVPVSYVGKLLEGFTLSAKPLPPKKVFPAPTLPRGFQPFHRFKKTAEQLAQEAIGEAPTTAGPQQGQQKLNAVERGLVLGETPIASSVFDLIPKEDIRKLEAAKDAARMTASRFQPAATAAESGTPTSLPPTGTPTSLPPTAEQAVAREAGKEAGAGGGRGGQHQALSLAGGPGVRPFHKDPPKQARYERYLALVKQGVKEPYKDVAPSHMTEWERQREKDEFSKSAKIYQPLSNMMASRFTRGAFIDDAEQQTSGLVEVVAEKSEQAKAAEMKMYGRLTREDMEWHPRNLLCKRFNVPNPYPESDIVGVPGLKRDKFSVFNFLTVPSQPPSASQDKPSAQDAPKTSTVTNSLTRELNASKRKKGALSIFSVLEEEESTPRKPLPALSFSETADSTNDADNKLAPGGTGSDDKGDENEEADDGRPRDLFRAIFKNSDSESSSSSEKSDSDKSDDDEEDSKEDKEHSSPAAPESLSRDNKDSASEQPSNQQSSQQPSPSVSTLSPSSPPHPPPPLPPPPPAAASTEARPRRKASRWEVGSIFDVLEQSPPRMVAPTQQEGAGEGGKGEERLSPPVSESASAGVDLYGPALPPPMSTGGSTVSAAVSMDVSSPGNSHHRHKHKHREQERDSSKHRHKKEKKKKSKHKKDKKKKKKSKHSHREHHRRHSSGSEADSDTDTDT